MMVDEPTGLPCGDGGQADGAGGSGGWGWVNGAAGGGGWGWADGVSGDGGRVGGAVP